MAGTVRRATAGALGAEVDRYRRPGAVEPNEVAAAAAIDDVIAVVAGIAVDRTAKGEVIGAGAAEDRVVAIAAVEAIGLHHLA